MGDEGALALARLLRLLRQEERLAATVDASRARL